MTLNSYPLRSIFEQFEETVRWLRSLDLDVEKTRIASYLYDLEQMALNFESDNNTKYSYLAASKIFQDIEPFIRIYEAFHHYPIESLNKLTTQLGFAIKGPKDISQETGSTSSARNYLFEALCSARLISSSAMSDLTYQYPGDTSFNFNGWNFNVECKRLKSERNAPKNFKKAIEQLEINEVHYRDRRIIALDISAIINPSCGVVQFKTDDIPSEMNKKIVTAGRYLERAANHFFGKNPKKWNAILYYFFCTTIDANNELVSCSEWAFEGNPYSPCTGDSLQKLVPIFNENVSYGS